MKSSDRQLGLKIYPDAVLRQRCEPVEKFDRELRDLIDEMLTLMRFWNGIGLAAPQVGITKRLFVCEIEKQSISLINPAIIDAEGRAELIEGCLSLPEVQVNVARSDRLFVRGHDVKGREKELELRGLWAQVVQHEMDHLDGVLICDYGENLEIKKF
jgi:peptide deformylase